MARERHRLAAIVAADVVDYGPLCMAIDVICDNVELPPLSPGDILTLHPVEAYNVVQSMQFISYRPAVVLVGASGIDIAAVVCDLKQLLKHHLGSRVAGDFMCS